MLVIALTIVFNLHLLIGRLLALAAQPISCLRRLAQALKRFVLAATVGRGRLALAAEGKGGALGLGQPHFEELIAEPALSPGGRLCGCL